MCVSELVAMTHDCAVSFTAIVSVKWWEVFGSVQKVETNIMGDVAQL